MFCKLRGTRNCITQENCSEKHLCPTKGVRLGDTTNERWIVTSNRVFINGFLSREFSPPHNVLIQMISQLLQSSIVRIFYCHVWLLEGKPCLFHVLITHAYSWSHIMSIPMISSLKHLPSGKRLHNLGKSSFFNGKHPL